MHIAVKLQLDKVSPVPLPSFEPEELNYWLTVAQERFVKQRFTGHNRYQEGFEGTQKRKDDLRELISSAYDQSPLATSASSLIYPNSWKVEMYGSSIYDAPTAGTVVDLLDYPNKYMFLYNIDVNVDRVLENNESVSGIWMEAMDKTHETAFKNLTTPFNLPYIEQPIFLLEHNYINIVTDPHTTAVNIVKIEYIKYPRKLVRSTGDSFLGTTVNLASSDIDEYTAESDLAEHTHQEIVELCANLLIENIESSRVQTNELKLSQQE
jgi:hypothetical protein